MAFKALRIICIILMLISSIFNGITISENEPMSDDITRAMGTTLYVGLNATYRSIQDAIDTSSPGDTVFVYNGKYTESLTIGKQINLIGESVENTIIYGPNYSVHVVNISADGVIISNMSINYSGQDVDMDRGGIHLYRAENCIIITNLITNYYGIGISLSESNNNTFIGNNITNSTQGIGLFDSHENNFTINNIYLNHPTGVSLERSNNNSFNNNNISRNQIGFWLQEANDNIISENNITHCYHGCITSEFSNNNLIENNNISSYSGGFYFWESNGNTLLNNTIRSLWSFRTNALYFVYSNDNVMKNNTLINTTFGIYGEMLEHWLSNDVDTSNTYNGEPIYFWKNKNSGTLPPNASNILLANCSNIKISNQNYINNRALIEIGFSSNITISDNVFINGSIYLRYSNNLTIRNNSFFDGLSSNLFDTIIDSIIINNTIINKNNGFYLSNSNNNIIVTNTIKNCNYGFRLSRSDHNILSNNIIEHGDVGIELHRSYYNTIEYNQIAFNNDQGINLWNSSKNMIIKNSIAFNKMEGIYLHTIHREPSEGGNVYCNENIIFHNNFIKNNNSDYQAKSEGTNTWDNGYPSGGNFWSDYKDLDEKNGILQDVSGSDGIGDEPYIILPNENTSDEFPLMQQIETGFGLPKIEPTAPRQIYIEHDYSTVELAWSPPIYDSGLPIIRYHIYRWTSYYGNGIYYGKWIEYTVPGDITEFVDNEVSKGQLYYYKVAAENEIGIGLNSSEEKVSLRELPKPPGDDGSLYSIMMSPRTIIICISFFGILILIIISLIIKRYFFKKLDIEKTRKKDKKKG